MLRVHSHVIHEAVAMTKTSQCVWAALVVTVTAIVGAGRGMQAAPQSTDSVPTFTHDVAPILYANCVTCHRPGEIAPMSLISYQEVRPWARAITQEDRRRLDAAVACGRARPARSPTSES